MKRKPKAGDVILTFRVGIGNGGSYGYKHCEIGVSTMLVRDMSERIKDAIAHNHAEWVQSMTERARQIYEATGTFLYLGEEWMDEGLSFRWQSDRENGYDNWYGPHLEMKPNERNLKLLTRVMRAAGEVRWDRDPREFVKSLQTIGAFPRQYHSAIGEHVIYRNFDLLAAIPLPALKAEPTAVVA